MFSFQCAAHLLHLIVKDFAKFDTVKAVFSKVQRWASLLHRSGPAMKMYQQFQEEEHLPLRVLPTVMF